MIDPERFVEWDEMMVKRKQLFYRGSIG